MARLKLLYFASLREALGCASETVELPADVHDAGQLRAWLAARSTTHADALGPDRALRVAIDQKLAGEHGRVDAAREVAFFPPVTGG